LKENDKIKELVIHVDNRTTMIEMIL